MPEPIALWRCRARRRKRRRRVRRRAVRDSCAAAACAAGSDRAPGATIRPRALSRRQRKQSATLVPDVRIAAVHPSRWQDRRVNLPATTSAFEAANIFARTSGYIDKRYVDIGDQVKAGSLLADITAPELDHQIAQAKATLAQVQATLQQTQASRELAQVTNDARQQPGQAGMGHAQQGDNDQLTLKAQEAAVGVAQANIAAQEAQIRVLEQQKAYQRVVAPFDGVITQRAIDSRQPGAGRDRTFMFTLMHGNVIRTQVFVPQDQAFGLGPGVEAVVRVPEIPDRTFPGKVTRIASACSRAAARC